MEEAIDSTARVVLYIADVARQLGVPEGTIRDWRLRGEGPPAAKFGRRLVWRQGDVDAWVDAQFAAADRAGPAA